MPDKTVSVWDPLVRIFHWSLAVTFFISYLTGEDGEDLHATVSYIVLGLIVFRIVWGFVGTKYARFSNFIYPPAQVVEYLRGLFGARPVHYLGHNPAGGWMVVLLLIFIFISCWTGLVAYGKEGHGPLASVDLNLVVSAMANDDDDGEAEGEEFWEEIHELFSDITLGLVFVHILGVIVSSRLHKEKLVHAMITGRKTVHEQDTSGGD